MTVKEICINAERLKEQCVYVYGAKYQQITENLLQTLKQQNPKTYTDSYLNKCRKKIGKIGIDCSGLVCKAAGLSHIGSYQMNERWTKLDKPRVGAAAWKQGHIALVYSVLESGKKVGVIEAKGVDYDCQYNIYDVGHFKSYLSIPSVVYDEKEEEVSDKKNWIQDDKGRWQYKDDQANYYKDCIVKLKWDNDQREDYFCFDKDGYMISSTVVLVKVDKNGCITDFKEVF